MTHLSLAPLQSDATEWARLVAEYHAAVAARESVTLPADVMNAGDEAEAVFDAAAVAANAALTAVCECPAPSFAALALKCELISAEYPDADHLDGQDAAYIIADVRQLATRENWAMTAATTAAPSCIHALHTRYEANMAEYALTEKAEYVARQARDDDANAFERALQTLCREADALRAAILYQVPDTWAEATILQFHITNAYDMIATADAAPGEDAITLSVAIDTLFDFMCCEIQQDHSAMGPSFSDGAVRVHFARRHRTGVVEG